MAIEERPVQAARELGVAGPDGPSGLGRPREHAVAGGEGGVARGGLGTPVGGAVAAHHLRGDVAEQVLDIKLPRVVRDCPGGEGMAEAMGVHLGDAGGAAEAPEQLLEPVRPEPD